MNGTCKFFQARSGYGFITGEDNNDYFVGFADIVSDSSYKVLNEGECVTFDVEEQDKAKFKNNKAVNVQTTNESTKEVGDGRQT